MSILDDENKIDEDFQITISKKIFKEALEEKSVEILNRFSTEYLPPISQLKAEIGQLRYELEIAKEIINQIKQYELYISDPELKQKIWLLEKSIDKLY